MKRPYILKHGLAFLWSLLLKSGMQKNDPINWRFRFVEDLFPGTLAWYRVGAR